MDESKQATIFLSAGYNHEWKTLFQKDGYTVIKTQNILGSIYFFPNRLIEEFETFLLNLQADIYPLLSEQIILAGDFNARLSVWQDLKTCPREERLEAVRANMRSSSRRLHCGYMGLQSHLS